MITSTSAIVGANVRAEMARKGISQETLAAAVKIDQGGLSRRLRGLRSFSIDEVTAVAAHLDVPLSTLVPELAASA